MAWCPQQAIAWTNVEFSLVMFYGIQLKSNFTASGQATILNDDFKITAASPRGQ